MKTNILFALSLLLICLSACKKQPTGRVVVQQSNAPAPEDPYLRWNQVSVEREDENIDFFIQRYGWKMQKTGTGLRYELLHEGTGNTPATETVVTLKYTTMLLTGDTIYSSEQQGVKKFRVDKSDEMTGLNEAVKLMRKGGRARIVLPSFLAYGVSGDGGRIRPQTSLAMYIELIDIQTDY